MANTMAVEGGTQLTYPVPEGFEWPTLPRSLQSCTRYLERLIELEAELLEMRWLGRKVNYRVRCAEGHLCSPSTESVLSGRGVCRACAGKAPADTERRTRELAKSWGATFVGPYTGTHSPCPLICRNGHECAPHPNSILRGQGVCKTCGGQDPADTEARFRELIKSGGHLFVGPYRGNKTPCPLICRNGHSCAPRPNGVLKGQGVCPVCAGQAHDVVYLVQSTDRETIKVGITSGDPQDRLRTHRANDFTKVLRLYKSLPGTAAKDAETAVCAALRANRFPPVRGREYFDAAALPLALRLVDTEVKSRLRTA